MSPAHWDPSRPVLSCPLLALRDGGPAPHSESAWREPHSVRPTGEGPSWPRPHPPPRGSFSLHFNPVLSSTVQRPVRHEGHPTTTHFQNVPPSRTAPCPRGTPTASSLPFSRPHSHHLLPVSMTGLRGLRVSGISQHLSFRDHLASLSIKSSRFIRVLARFRISLLFFFLFKAKSYCTVHPGHDFSMHPPVRPHRAGGGGAPTGVHPSVDTGGCSHSGPPVCQHQGLLPLRSL